jgi:hypothetical protein
MSDEEQTISTEQSTSTTETQTLDDVYKTYNVEETAKSFQPQTAQPQQSMPQPAPQSAPAMPDAVLDPNGFKTWLAQQGQFTQQALSQISGQLTQFQQQAAREKEEAAIKQAVSKFKETVGDGVDDDLAEVALGAKARKDPRFAAVYRNRDQNPQAWNAAVAAYANEFKGKVSYKTDPQIAENVRAAKNSTGSQATRPKGPSGDEAYFEGKGGNEFTATWNQYINRGQY